MEEGRGGGSRGNESFFWNIGGGREYPRYSFEADQQLPRRDLNHPCQVRVCVCVCVRACVCACVRASVRLGLFKKKKSVGCKRVWERDRERDRGREREGESARCTIAGGTKERQRQ